MHLSIYSALKKPENSFSLWDSCFPTNACICNTPHLIESKLMHANISKLKANPIFVGLNYSRAIKFDFQNFHDTSTRSKDIILKNYIQIGGLKKLQGTLMTDLILNPYKK